MKVAIVRTKLKNAKASTIVPLALALALALAQPVEIVAWLVAVVVKAGRREVGVGGIPAK